MLRGKPELCDPCRVVSGFGTGEPVVSLRLRCGQPPATVWQAFGLQNGGSKDEPDHSTGRRERVVFAFRGSEARRRLFYRLNRQSP